MTETIDEVCARVARQVAGRYARRCWWADRTEVEQQAWAFVLEVREQNMPLGPDGQPDVNAFGAWAWSAAVRRMSRWLWRQQAITSAPDKKVKEMRGQRRMSLDGSPETGSQRALGSVEQLALQFSDPRPSVSEQAERTVELERLVERLRELMGDTPLTQAAISVVIGGEAPLEVAQRTGLPVRHIHKTGDRLVEHARSDGELGVLLREMARERGWNIGPGEVARPAWKLRR